ncbi:BON domain-containing protein [Dyella amyloliquefaciens]|uniref:BON domain-containing protein n=1 Tax=Dyella amyloliquefaciens TaxID=1770545 RepID=UPI0013EECCE0|nr:BON domain-containing protein [Dyella amyloliquefaciens]
MRFRSIVFGTLIVSGTVCFAQTTPPAGAGATPTAPPTMPMHDPNNPNRTIPSPSAADVQLASNVQQTLQRDNSLSPAAHQVKIIASDGAVVLRGSVANDAEKTKIDSMVRGMPGVKEVTNELDVKH